MPVDVSQYLTIGAFDRNPALLETYRAYLEVVLKIPDVQLGLHDGLPFVAVRGKLLSRLRTKTDCALALRYDVAERDKLIAARPDAYFITEAYRSYPLMLVRLEKVPQDELPSLVEAAARAI